MCFLDCQIHRLAEIKAISFFGRFPSSRGPISFFLSSRKFGFANPMWQEHFLALYGAVSAVFCVVCTVSAVTNDVYSRNLALILVCFLSALSSKIFPHLDDTRNVVPFRPVCCGYRFLD